MPEGYLHLTCEQRCQIYALLQSGHSQAHIARQIGVDPSTISRELVRNTGARGYRFKQAHEKASQRREEASDKPRKMLWLLAFDAVVAAGGFSITAHFCDSAGPCPRTTRRLDAMHQFSRSRRRSILLSHHDACKCSRNRPLSLKAKFVGTKVGIPQTVKE